MGGEAAKERRRLKRLQKQQSGGDAASGVNSESESPKKRTDSESGKTLGSDAALNRLRRKMERRSSGKWKPQSVSKPASPPSINKKRDARNENKGRNDNTQWKRRRENGNHDKGDNNSKDWRSRDNTKGGNPRRDNSKGGTPRGKPYKKKTATKHKVQKPKHLKRKLGQLSKAMSEPAEGNTLDDLEGQMKVLIQQMEEYKKLKQTRGDKKNSADADTARAKSEKDDEVRAEADSKDDQSSSSVDEGEAIVTAEEGTGSGDAGSSSDSSSSDDDSIIEADKKQDKPSSSVDEEEVIDTTEKGNGSGDADSSSDSSSSDDDSIIVESTRTRGKRRRGRRESKQTKDSAVKNEDEPPKVALRADCEKEVVKENKFGTSADSKQPSTKKTSKKDDKRRCIGRKPVTDYVVGQTYTGTVRQIEPKLGAFIDIGSHSDAFCHISCLSDKYTKHIEDVVKVDDVLSNVRVLEIDRQKKRLTVSLRSPENAENEQERLKLTRQYERKIERPSSRKHQGSPKSGHTRFDDEMPARAAAQGEVTVKPHESPAATQPFVQPSKQKSGADLKRERKLQRRAERRAQREAAAS